MTYTTNTTIDMMKYEEAVRQLEDIVRKMENDELDIDTLSEQLKTAQKLLKLRFCLSARAVGSQRQSQICR